MYLKIVFFFMQQMKVDYLIAVSILITVIVNNNQLNE